MGPTAGRLVTRGNKALRHYTEDLLLPIGPLDEIEDESYFVVPPLDPAGDYMAVFPDGSYTRWIPPHDEDDDDVEEPADLAVVTAAIEIVVAAEAAVVEETTTAVRRGAWREVFTAGMALVFLPLVQIVGATFGVGLDLT